ncbi:LOW QUALITY PROTEIN: Putative uncharacterized transposon-derived protein [Frankliniella fusca]|uniref:Uncharacterized transposon-derived protein n=1 Tax=Frankliniella fusca TaxID=407009 RepID=A0AAE1LP56_9NEOP|nr:LOW QUALITY PROTEIN: Putative uncharacterized transposon-derived protein [Frankliniella fusca]
MPCYLITYLYHEPADPASYGTAWKLWDATGEQKEKITEYLQGEDAYTLHKPARRRFPRNVTYADNIDESWQTDLTDFQSLKKDNDGFGYILCMFSQNMDGLSPSKINLVLLSLRGFKLIFESTDRRPTRLFSDKEKEYINKTFQKFLKENNITYIQTHNPDIKYGLLDDIVDAYNHTYHRSIKMRPVDVTPGRVLEYKVGDYVRISREKLVKGYTWNWSEEIFQIVQVIPHAVPVYGLEDLDKDPIEGTFYEMELQKVTKPEAFKIAYIVRSKGTKGKRQHLVHWRGYPEKSRSWIFDKDLV